MSDVKVKNEVYIYGIHAVTAAIKNPQRQIKKVYLSNEKQNKNLETIASAIENKKIPCEYIPGKLLNQKFPDCTHQGIVALAEKLPEYHEKDIGNLLSDSSFILILDGVTDPHNLGACVRTADAAGVDFIIIPKDKSVGVNATVAKVSSGAVENVPIIKVTNLARTISKLKEAGVWIYGAAEEAQTSIYELNFCGSIALVLGAEGSGLRHLTKEKCDGLFSIPMHGSVSSLNVSVATGVALFEVVRQRFKNVK